MVQLASVFVYSEIDGFIVLLPRSKCSESSSHMCIDNLESVNIAGINPSETKIIRTLKLVKHIWRTYPSLATPLKSDPWLPYSASTLCGSITLVTSYFSTTTPLKSTNAVVIMNNHLYTSRSASSW